MSGDLSLNLPWLAAPLRTLAAAQGHAWILQGALGDGLAQLARLTVAAWLCEADAPHQPACGHCVSCNLLAAGTHPDVRWLLPEALQLAFAWPGADGSGFDSKARNPSKEIRIEAVREAIDWAHSSSARGRGKVLLLLPADAMNAVSAAALLKTLEEPPAGVRLLLATESAERLLPTLRSRCQRLLLPAPGPQVAAAWLAAQDMADSPALLAAAGGQPLAALQWPAQGLSGALWRALPGALAGVQTGQGSGQALAAWAALPARAMIDVLQRLAHDALCLAAGASPRFVPQGWPPPPQGLALQPLLRWQAELRRLAAHADHGWNAPLLVDALAVQAREALAPLFPAKPAGERRR